MRVIAINEKNNRRIARIGDKVLVTVKKGIGNFKKGQILKGLLVNSAYPLVRKDGTSISFKDNVILLISESKDGFQLHSGTRIMVPIPIEILPKLNKKVKSMVRLVV